MGRSSPTVAIQSSFCGLIIISLNSLVATSISPHFYLRTLILGHLRGRIAGKGPFLCRDILSLSRHK